MNRLLIIYAYCVLALIQSAGAQSRILPQPAEADSSITVSLLTCAPGSDIYELEGHSGLRMQYGDGIDLTANWGLFDFASPGFVYRFVKGETDYSVGVCPTAYFVEAYRRQGRRISEQVINLTPRQAAQVIELVEENLQPANRIYRYNYVKDNCATRPLQILERAIGDTIRFTTTAAEQLGHSPTYRSEMMWFHRNYPWYQFGIDLALGSGLDYEISTRETIFAPVILHQLAADAVIATPDGEIPFVKSTAILSEGTADGMVESPTPWYLTPLFASLVLLFVAAALSIPRLINFRATDKSACRPRRIGQWFDAILFSIYGIIGIVIAFLVFVSVHEASSPNLLLLCLNPLCLLVPIAQWSVKTRKIATIYHVYNIIASLVVLFILCIGLQVASPAISVMIAAGILRSLVNVR